MYVFLSVIACHICVCFTGNFLYRQVDYHPSVHSKYFFKGVNVRCINHKLMITILILQYMKALMKKVDGFKEDTVNNSIDTNPKKIRNRPLFYVKVSLISWFNLNIY